MQTLTDEQYITLLKKQEETPESLTEQEAQALFIRNLQTSPRERTELELESSCFDYSEETLAKFKRFKDELIRGI